MGNISENWTDYINWLITFFTFIGGIFLYVNHTRKLNQQQTKLNSQQEQLNNQQNQLNEYQLQKSKEESIEKKQAFIEANVYSTADSQGKPAWRMKIYNRGKAKATNINFEAITLNNDPNIHLIFDPHMFPIPSLNPHGAVEIVVVLSCGHQLSHRFKFTWDDESRTNRSEEQDVIFQ